MHQSDRLPQQGKPQDQLQLLHTLTGHPEQFRATIDDFVLEQNPKDLLEKLQILANLQAAVESIRTSSSLTLVAHFLPSGFPLDVIERPAEFISSIADFLRNSSKTYSHLILSRNFTGDLGCELPWNAEIDGIQMSLGTNRIRYQTDKSVDALYLDLSREIGDK